MDAVIYVRTSTEEQTPENQIKDCHNINFWGTPEIIQDKQSAWKEKDRVGFEKLKKLISSKKVKHLIVWDLDRIYRNRKNLIKFFEFCKFYNCKVHSFRQGWLEKLHKIPEPFNEIMFNLMLQIMGWLAEEESTKKSDRVKLAVRKKGNKTYSYRGNKWGRKGLSTRTKNRIKELRKDKGLSMREIAEELNISIGSVHKSIQEFITEEVAKKEAS